MQSEWPKIRAWMVPGSAGTVHVSPRLSRLPPPGFLGAYVAAQTIYGQLFLTVIVAASADITKHSVTNLKKKNMGIVLE